MLLRDGAELHVQAMETEANDEQAISVARSNQRGTLEQADTSGSVQSAEGATHRGWSIRPSSPDPRWRKGPMRENEGPIEGRGANAGRP